MAITVSHNADSREGMDSPRWSLASESGEMGQMRWVRWGGSGDVESKKPALWRLIFYGFCVKDVMLWMLL